MSELILFVMMTITTVGLTIPHIIPEVRLERLRKEVGYFQDDHEKKHNPFKNTILYAVLVGLCWLCIFLIFEFRPLKEVKDWITESVPIQLSVYVVLPFLLVALMMYVGRSESGCTMKTVNLGKLLPENIFYIASKTDTKNLGSYNLKYEDVPVLEIKRIISREKEREKIFSNVHKMEYGHKNHIDKNASVLIQKGKERVDMLKVEIDEMLSELFDDLISSRIIEKQLHHTEELEQLIEREISAISEEERIEVQELKSILKSDKLPESVVQKAKKSLDDIIEKQAVASDTTQGEIDKAKAIIRAAQMANGLKETKEE